MNNISPYWCADPRLSAARLSQATESLLGVSEADPAVIAGGPEALLPGVWYANLFTAFFGFFPRGFFSTDYFPLLPWLFLFWAGYFLHFCMGRARMEPLRRSVCAPLGWLGRHSLGIYLLHQPVIYGGLLLLFHVFEQ